jgi:hypothetical protein
VCAYHAHRHTGPAGAGVASLSGRREGLAAARAGGLINRRGHRISTGPSRA